MLPTETPLQLLYYLTPLLFILPIVPLEDTVPPVIRDCPVSTLTVNVPTGVPSRPVTWTEPTATDNSGETPTVTQSHQPGDIFPVGTTDVSYTFSDMSGNDAICSFSVEVGKLSYDRQGHTLFRQGIITYPKILPVIRKIYLKGI